MFRNPLHVALSLLCCCTAPLSAQEWWSNPLTVQPLFTWPSLVTRPDTPLEAFKLGEVESLRISAVEGTSVRGLAAFELGLSQTATVERGDPRGQAGADRADLAALQGESRFYLEPNLQWLFGAREFGAAGGPPTRGATNRLEWQPLDNVQLSTQLERQSTDPYARLRFATQLQYMTLLGALSYDWQNQSDGPSWYDRFRFQSGEWTLGALSFSLDGQLERFGVTQQASSEREALAGNIRILIGATEIRFRYQMGREDATTARLLLPLFDRTALDMSYDGRQPSSGLFNQRLGVDIKFQPVAELQLATGFELREGVGWETGRYGATHQRLHLGVQLPRIEFHYWYNLPLAGQTGGDTFSIKINSDL